MSRKSDTIVQEEAAVGCDSSDEISPTYAESMKDSDMRLSIVDQDSSQSSPVLCLQDLVDSP